MLRIPAALMLAALCLLSGPAAAQSQVFVFEEGVSGFSGFEDTTIFSDVDNSGGGTDGIFSGTILNLTFGGDTRHRRALIRVDLTGIPPGYVVEDVSLQMTVEMSGGNFGDIDYTLHRVTDTWGEGTVVGPSAGGFGAPADNGDATWNSNRHNISAWITPGADFIAAPSATAAAGVAGTDVTWNAPGMIADVQAWVNSPSANHGWIVISSIEGVRQRIKKFHSSEAVAFRPVLTVTASPPTVPNRPILWVCLLLVLGGLGTIGVRRFSQEDRRR